jgi:hypothetical protein
MKKILSFLFGTDRKKQTITNVTLHHRVVNLIKTFITKQLKKFISRKDFARQPRSIKELPRWNFLQQIEIVILPFRKTFEID